MNARKILRINGLAWGALMLGFLATSFSGSPVKWMQNIFLDSFGIDSSGSAHVKHFRESALIETDPMQLAKTLGRPAGKPGESQEEIEIGKVPEPIPPGQIRRASKAELLEQCQKLPKCRATLQAVNQGKRPPNTLPAGKPGESQEDKTLSTLPKPIPPVPPRQSPRSGLDTFEPNSTLLSWLNPFAVSSAHAQSAFSLYLTPQNRYTPNPYGYMHIFGPAYWGSYRLQGKGQIIINHTTLTENKPYVYLAFNVPADGWYLINFQASQGKAKLRHRVGPIIETWDFTAQSCSRCDYLTAEYLVAGHHYFYFWPDETDFYFYSASVNGF